MKTFMTKEEIRVAESRTRKKHGKRWGPIADVVYVDPEQPRHCGINLEKPENVSGMSSPPDDWHEGDTDPDP
jgi:hypothetical protein